MSLSGTTNHVFVIRGELCRCYHYALCGDFRSARNILHFMNMYERSVEVETHTQILYNRAFARVGLCAFRQGLVAEAHHHLMEVCAYNKSKELLAQGVVFQRYNERNPEQEKTERRRQLPYHMHIPTEHMDAAHLISALLLEVPNMMMQQLNPGHRRLISRALRKYLESMEKNLFLTPPETNREYILHATLQVQKGHWAQAMDYLRKIRFLSEIVDVHHLTAKVKDVSLRCYCLRYATSYDSLDLAQLSKMFDLSAKEAHSICSKMILEGDVPFAWDQNSKILIVNHGESQSSLQKLTQALADKTNSFIEQYERIVDFKTGNYHMTNKDSTQTYGARQGTGSGFRDVYSEEVRYFNRSKYANMPRSKGQIVAGSKGFRKGKGKTNKGKGKGSGMQSRAAGWNRGARDYAVGYSFNPTGRESRGQWNQY